MISIPSDRLETIPNIGLNNDMGLSGHIQDLADLCTSDVDSSHVIGTHSNFANQQAGPDSTHVTLSEVNAKTPPRNAEHDTDSEVDPEDSHESDE